MPQINTTIGLHTGLGDMVCLSWIAEGTRATRDPVTFYATHSNHLILKILGQEVSDRLSDRWVAAGDSYLTELKERGKRLRLDYLREFLGIEAPFKRPRVVLSPADIEWAHQSRRDLGGGELVLLFPQALFPSRTWPAAYWVDLAWQLKEKNIATMVMLAYEDKRFTNTPRYAWGYALNQIAALMTVSNLVVGNDSGPAHLAGTIGVPTIVALGPTRRECVFGHLPEVIGLSSDAPPGCAGCSFSAPYRAACDQGCQMLYALKPDAILQRVLEELAKTTRPQARVSTVK
ncbi:MAG TPA: glycosyltransferase family 9 protein [Pirellulales bacterium]